MLKWVDYGTHLSVAIGPDGPFGFIYQDESHYFERGHPEPIASWHLWDAFVFVEDGSRWIGAEGISGFSKVPPPHRPMQARAEAVKTVDKAFTNGIPTMAHP